MRAWRCFFSFPGRALFRYCSRPTRRQPRRPGGSSSSSSRRCGGNWTSRGADPSDIAAKATELGRDADRIFAFLRDQISLEPYSGVLRGAKGTLAAGAGNALDRSLLAQELLKASGIESRLMSGKLTDEQARSLLGRYLSSDALAGPLAALGQDEQAGLDAAARDIAVKAGLPAELVTDVLQRAAARATTFWWDTDEQQGASYELLAKELKAAPAGPTNNTADLHAISGHAAKRALLGPGEGCGRPVGGLRSDIHRCPPGRVVGNRSNAHRRDRSRPATSAGVQPHLSFETEGPGEAGGSADAQLARFGGHLCPNRVPHSAGGCQGSPHRHGANARCATDRAIAEDQTVRA